MEVARPVLTELEGKSVRINAPAATKMEKLESEIATMPNTEGRKKAKVGDSELAITGKPDIGS